MARILFLTERFPPDIGGLATSSHRISHSIAKLGHDVDVLAWSRHVPAGKVAEQELDNNSEQYRVFRQGLYRQWDMSMPATQNVLDWLHAEKQYDLIWGHYLSPAGFLSVWFGKLNAVKSIVSARGNDIDTAVFPPGDFSRLTWTLQNASAVVSVSQDIAKKIRQICNRDQIDVLPNVVDTNIFSPAVEHVEQLKIKLGIKPDELVLGFAGELREKKGVQFLLDAFRYVRERRPACLLIIGDLRSNQKPSMQLFNAEFPLDAQRIVITGHIDQPIDVAAHLNVCDVFLQPSLMEGMPNAVIESMACSRLCIASDAGGIPELIKHEQNGFLIPRAQLNHLGEAIMDTLELDGEKRNSIVGEARKTVLENHTIDHELNQLDALLKRVLSSSLYAEQSSSAVISKL